MTPRHTGLLAALAGIWGGSYLLIKYALEDFDPAFVVWARTTLAALVLAVIGHRADTGAAWRDLRSRPGTALGLGVLAVALPFCLITFGELAVPSGLTAVLIAPASIFVAMLAPLLDDAERVGPVAATGMAVGLGGVALLVGVESVASLRQFAGATAIVGSAASYALAGYVVKGAYAHLSSRATSLISIGVASFLVLPLAAVSLPSHPPGLRALLAIVALGVVGTALAFAVFYALIAEIGAGRASLVSYLAPGVALGYGASLRGERVGLAAVGGLALILLGVALASRRPTAVGSRGRGPVADADRGGLSRRRARVARGERPGRRAR